MNGDSIKVSIVLPAYNGAKYIRKSIDSCLNQTYKNIELIIVDDNSVDEIPEIIKSYKDERIKYIRHEKNRGLSHALNTGFANATGEYLTWTSDDNIYASEAIKYMVKMLNTHKKIYFLYASFKEIDEEGHIIRQRKVGSTKKLKRKNCIGPCFLYRRKVYEEIGNYSPEAFLAEDYEYWLRIYKRFHMQKLNKFLYYFRIHKDSLSSQYLGEPEMLTEKIIDKYGNISKATKYYLCGRREFFKKNYKGARKFLLKSLFHNPFVFDFQDHSILALSTLDERMIKIIRKIRNLIKKWSGKF